MIATIFAWIGAAFGTVVLGTGIAARYHRRPARNTITMASTFGLRRGMVLSLNSGRPDGELVIIRRVLGPTSVAIDPYAGWRKWANRTRAHWRRRCRVVKDRVYGWFEKDDDDD